MKWQLSVDFSMIVPDVIPDQPSLTAFGHSLMLSPDSGWPQGQLSAEGRASHPEKGLYLLQSSHTRHPQSQVSCMRLRSAASGMRHKACINETQT